MQDSKKTALDNINTILTVNITRLGLSYLSKRDFDKAATKAYKRKMEQDFEKCNFFFGKLYSKSQNFQDILDLFPHYITGIFNREADLWLQERVKQPEEILLHARQRAEYAVVLNILKKYQTYKILQGV